MDNNKVGKFIATRLKEKGLTQTKLAKMLNVTNKAISKWENGLGFPDVNLLEPLADALEVSLVELMHGQTMGTEDVEVQEVQPKFEEKISLSEYERRLENRNIILGSVFLALVMAILFLVIKSNWIATVIAYLPYGLFVVGLILIVYSIKRWKRGEKYILLVMIGLVGILAPFLPGIILLICLIFLK